MKLLLKIKNGTPPMRKAAMRQITDKAREFGAAALFNQILPLLMSPTLEDQVGLKKSGPDSSFVRLKRFLGYFIRRF